jgi:hypothetical protein
MCCMWEAMARILKGGLEVAPGVLRRFQWEHGQGIREHWDGHEFQTRVELQVAFIET